MPAFNVVPAAVELDPVAHENLHVHAIYDQIASHFSSTRYKASIYSPWPIIAEFLDSLPPGSIGLDSGTGNGKYLPLPLDRPSSIWTIGLDRSHKLLEIAQNAGGKRREVVWGDALGCGWRVGAFDYAISIATIHHIATPTRRRLAIETLLRCISPSHGRVLVYVWAIEQDDLSKRILPSGDHVDPMRGLDVFVPWVQSKPTSGKDDENENPHVYNRYYHMFASGELEALTRQAAVTLGLEINPRPKTSEADPSRARKGVEIVRCGWERSNWYIELKRWEI
ncbi:hypothetical protein BU17DRAFT_57511 [Hysterangium stoloniferum]|nr:hypothetical protein BU17DRAFT_57511 [Hysterangium stoloniferum]